MSVLEKATLQEIASDESGTPLGDPVPVQFNPATLKLKLTNRIEGGRSQGRQVRQYVGSSSNVLSLDLVFDTADDATTEQPRSVLERTALVEKFIQPKTEGSQAKDKPPKLRFHWGNLIIDGVVESVDIEFDHFAPNGVPLRAKLGVSIQQQKVEFQFLESGPGANLPGNAPEPGQAAAGAPGSTGGGFGDRSALALAGESAAEFAVRMGLAADAWRGLGADLSAGLGLEAGIEVGFSAGLSASVGLGVNVGVRAGVDLSLEAAFGLEASVGASAGFGASVGASLNADLAAGFALSAAGGVSAASDSVQKARSDGASQAAREAFAAPAALGPGASAAATTLAPTAGGEPRISRQPTRPEQSRTPLATSGARTPAQQASARPAPSLPKPDPRSATYGFGVPLRPRVTGAAEERQGTVRGGTRLGPQAGSGQPLFATAPTVSPWEQLPARDPGRAEADLSQEQRRPRKPCACLGPCRHWGGRR